jgi:thiaminase/transcriptional activator TenA
MTAPGFSENLWSSICDIYSNILTHPFITELANGKLPPATFKYYIIQDSFYLQEFARSLAVLAARAPEKDAIAFFAKAAEETITVERALHEHYFKIFGIDNKDIIDSLPSLACRSYTNFLLATCYNNSYSIGCAAILPCFWIYLEVGKHIANQATYPNPYHEWIDTYAGDAFSQTLEMAKHFTNQAAASASAVEKSRMLEAFRLSAQMELDFWESAYRCSGLIERA